jgi:hypothetical protein
MHQGAVQVELYYKGIVRRGRMYLFDRAAGNVLEQLVMRDANDQRMLELLAQLKVSTVKIFQLFKAAFLVATVFGGAVHMLFHNLVIEQKLAYFLDRKHLNTHQAEKQYAQ